MNGSASQRFTRHSPRAAGALLVLAVLAAFFNTWRVPFVFDDVPAILENRSLRRLWPLTDVLVPHQAGGLTTSGRPVVNLSLAVNYAISGTKVWSYHVVNLLIHTLAGLILYGLLRRTLLLDRRTAAASTAIAGITAAWWLLHPLQTEAVTYVVQRAESLAGLFCLFTLYAFGRGAEEGRSTPQQRAWFAASIASCALAMASKEVAVGMPLLVLLYDRTFLAGSFRQAWRTRGRIHLGLAATWILLAWLVAGTGNRGGTAGFASNIAVGPYVLTQCRAVVHYIRLAAWPSPLVFDYGMATVSHFDQIWPQAMMIAAAIVVIMAMLRRPAAAGFLGAWFFVCLAPSSSVVPVATQTMAEHRMYLALAAPLAFVVGALFRGLGARALPAGMAVTIALGVATHARNHAYRSEAAIWADTASHLPTNARAHNNLGQALDRADDFAGAIACYERALSLQPKYPETHYNLAVALARRGDLAEAIGHYETALRYQPAYPEAENNLANALLRTGHLADALRHYQSAVAINPDFPEAYNNLGNALLQSDRVAESIDCFHRALALKPDYAEAHYNLGNAFAASGQMAEAFREYQRALALKADYAEADVNAGNALLQLGRPLEAVAHYRHAIAVNPNLAEASLDLGSVLLQLERWSEAIPPLEQAVRSNPDSPAAHRALGFALAKVGRVREALPHYETYLRAEPGDRAAQDELADLRARIGGH